MSNEPTPIDSEIEFIQLGSYSLSLPKKDLVKHWGRLQKHMELYLEDYDSKTKNTK